MMKLVKTITGKCDCGDRVLHFNGGSYHPQAEIYDLGGRKFLVVFGDTRDFGCYRKEIIDNVEVSLRDGETYKVFDSLAEAEAEAKNYIEATDWK
jgi:hypothetical protein